MRDTEVADRLADAAAAAHRLVLPLYCLGESYRVLTEPGGVNLPPSVVQDRFTRWLATIRLLLPGAGFQGLLFETIARFEPRGAAVYDCQILALCIEHGVDELWTFDRDFPADARLRIVDPLDP